MDPVVADLEEKDKILNSLDNPKDEEYYFIEYTDNHFRLNSINNSCIFYEDNKCTIYQIRPLDCRIFPFDFIKKDNKIYLILYTNPIKNCHIDSNKFIIENLTTIRKLTERMKELGRLEIYSNVSSSCPNKLKLIENCIIIEEII